MSKRLYDTGLWNKEWYRRLTPAEKAAWSYLLSECDNVGVLRVDFEHGNFLIGEMIDWEGLPAKVNGNIKVLDNGKWWLSDFCAFQYGDLTQETTNRARMSHIALLKKHDLWGIYVASMGQGDCRTAVLDKDKDKELDKEKDKDKKDYAEAVRLTPSQYSALVDKFGTPATKKAIDKLSAYKMSKGKQYKSDYHAILQWTAEAVGAQPLARAGPKGWKCPHCGAANTHTGSQCLSCKEDRDEEVKK